MRKYLRKFVIKIIQLQAGYYLKKCQPQIIFICGTINRTDLKKSILNTLEQANINARCNFKGYNSQIGLPLSILGLQAGFSSIRKWIKLLIKGFLVCLKHQNCPQYLILEIAIINKKEAHDILKYIKPNIVIFSDFLPNVSEKSSNFFIFKKILKSIIGQGYIIYNNDNNLTNILVNDFQVKKISIGQQKDSDYRITNIEQKENGQEFNLQNQGIEYRFQVNRFGHYSIYNSIIKLIFKHKILPIKNR